MTCFIAVWQEHSFVAKTEQYERHISFANWVRKMIKIDGSWVSVADL